MKVFLVLKTYERESTEVLSVYASRDRADACAARLNADDEWASYSVEERQVIE